MAVPLLDLKCIHEPIREQLLAAITDVVDSGGFTLGPNVEAFEAELAAYCGVGHAIGLASGTDAMLIALMALGIGAGDEVIVPGFTFFATAGSVHRTGATPVFVDVDPRTYNIDPARIESAITDQTRAILPVHLYGQSADMTPIIEIAERHGLAVIEDAAQAIGARDHDRKVCSLGTVGCLSFFPTKNLGAFGDGGMCLTDDALLADKIRIMRVHGEAPRDEYHLVGGMFRLHAMQAAVLRVKLKHLDDHIAARRANADRYQQRLADLPIDPPAVSDGAFHVYNQYTIRSAQRDALCEHLKQHDIGHRVYYPTPLHTQPCFANLGYKADDLPESQRAADQVVSLPVYPGMTESQIDEVADVIGSFLKA